MTTRCGRSIPRSAARRDVRSRSADSVPFGFIRRCEPRANTISSTGRSFVSSMSARAPRSQLGPSAYRSPARWAAVTSGKSTGSASTRPVTAGPVGAIAGTPSPSATTATGHSCVPSAPTSAVTAASGKRLCSAAGIPAESAAASTWLSIVPASQ